MVARRSRPLPLLLAALTAACGGPLVGDGYLGTPRMLLEGQVTMQAGVPEPDNPRLSLFWLGYDTRHLARSALEQRTVLATRFPATFSLALLSDPPPEALPFSEAATGARLGVAFIAVYSDLNENEMMNSDPLEAPAGPDMLIGASTRHVVVYSEGEVEPGSRLALLLATTLGPGYHLLESETPIESCTNAGGLECGGVVSLTEVDPGTPLEVQVYGDPWSVVLPQPAALVEALD